ncbi:MAG: hypothetical protein CMG11_04370 [Candidatus Marinimicrobia bacterium]|nr:hypothetical protein [Candidatus Neomarinimicrobiota bacterium]|tara:strand:+ start:420 stop:1109 length:690 start_codon:yes stop_codon:yes gene_type:complete
MDNKMKGIIGGVIGLAVLLILIFTLTGKSVPEKVAGNFIDAGDDWITAMENAENKEQYKEATKEAITAITELVPGAIVDLYSFIEDLGGFKELSKESNKESMEKYFQSMEKDWEDLEKRLNNAELLDKNKKIIDTMNDKDYTEMVKYALDALVNMSKVISEDEKTMEAVNGFRKEIASSFSDEEYKPLKKQDIDEFVTEYKEKYDNISSYDKLIKRLSKDFRFLGFLFQ